MVHPPRVVVSRQDPRYFELADGTPYVPVGFNLVGSPSEDELTSVVSAMASNRVNFCRIWVGHGIWDVEGEESGVYDEAKAKVLDRFLAEAGRGGIRVKMCLEYFRDIPAVQERWSDRILHHRSNGGPFTGMDDFLNSPAGLAQFIRKLQFYRDRYGDRPDVFAWELWNEANCLNGDWRRWTRTMLPEVHRIFSKHLVVQSLGSFDGDACRENYRNVCGLAGNDVAQVHRYLDLGAALAVCRGPVDVLAADAVRELRAFGLRKPILLAETGAVKPHHAGCSELHAKDPEGMLVHDMLFAPFFAGAAGTGNPWFWRECLQKPNHWHHFARFAAAVEGTAPPSERFEPSMLEHERLRVYVLTGRTTLLAWCRDARNDWQSELVQGQPPERLEGLTLELGTSFKGRKLKSRRAYDPWLDAWADLEGDDGLVKLPAFRRSIVVRLEYGE